MRGRKYVNIGRSLFQQYWWVLVVVNLLGTLFGFWFYRVQLTYEPLIAWPIVPDSPTATLFFAASLVLAVAYKRGDGIHAAAFLGGLKFGLWTPAVLFIFRDTVLTTTSTPMYIFLFVSHLGMAVQVFLIPLYADISFRGLGLGVVWYVFNDVVDYFIPIVGSPHHTTLPGQGIRGEMIRHIGSFHWPAATIAVACTVIGTLLLVYWWQHPKNGTMWLLDKSN